MSQRFCTFALVHTHAIGRMGGTATYWKASLMLCFWLFERRKLKSCTKTKAEVNATGVVYTPGVCRGLTMPSRTLFGCTIYLPAWVFRLCSFYWEGCGRPKRGTADEDTPLFICHLHKVKTILASGYQSGTYCH